MTDATITRSDDADGPPTLTISFQPPLAFKKGTIDQFVLREPKAHEVKKAEQQRSMESPWAGQTAYEIKLISLVGGLSQLAAEALPVMVVNHASTFLAEFVEAGPDDTSDPDPDDDQDEAPAAAMMPIDPPISFAGVTYSELDLHEPSGGQVRNARLFIRQAGSLYEARQAQMALIIAVTELPAPVINELRITTLNSAARVLGRFTTAGRPTGKR